MYNPFKLHIRRTSNGKFGLAKFSLFFMSFRFKDLKNPDYYWGTGSSRFENCLVQFPKDLKLPKKPTKLTHRYYENT